MKRLTALLFIAGIAGMTAAGADKAGKATEKVLPGVIAAPVQEEIFVPSVWEIGEVKAEESVDLVARVSGYLDKVNFVEGTFVKQGTVLFEIDPRQYEAEVKKAKGQLERAQADQKHANIEYERQKGLFEKNTVSKREFDQAEANKLSADAEMLSAEAGLKLAELDLSYTKIVAPFDGWVGFKSCSAGNMVGPNSGKLATIEKSGVIKVSFHLPELAIMQISENAKKAGKSRTDAPVELYDQTGKKVPLNGRLSAWDNRINLTTGTLKLQAVFQDPDRVLLPGAYVKVKVQSGASGNAVMLRESAMVDDVSGTYVMVIKDNGNGIGTAERRYIKKGESEGGRLRVLEGLKSGELVIVAGLQKVRNGSECKYRLEGQNPQELNGVKPEAKPAEGK